MTRAPDHGRAPEDATERSEPAQLVDRLRRDYVDVPGETVIRLVTGALQSIELFGEIGDEMSVAERIARQELDFVTGRSQEMARLDPESRSRRRPDSA